MAHPIDNSPHPVGWMNRFLGMGSTELCSRIIELEAKLAGVHINSMREIQLWIDNFDVTSQNVGDLEQQFEDLLREQTDQRIRESEGLDWKSIAYITARLKVEMGYTCASSIEGYGDEE